MSKGTYEEALANYMVEEGANNTSNGSYFFYVDELATVLYDEMMFSDEEPAEMWLLKHSREIVDEIDSHEEILSETWLEYDDNGVLEGFNLDFGLAYCPSASWDAWEGIEVDCIDFLADKYAKEPTDANYQELLEGLEYHYSLNSEDAADLASLVIECDSYADLEDLLNGWRPEEAEEAEEDGEDEEPNDYTRALELLADVLCDYNSKIDDWGDDWGDGELKSLTEPRDKLARALGLLSRPLEMVRVNYSVHTDEEDEDDALVDLPEEEALDFLVSLADKDSTIWSVKRVTKGTPSPWK